MKGILPKSSFHLLCVTDTFRYQVVNFFSQFWMYIPKNTAAPLVREMKDVPILSAGVCSTCCSLSTHAFVQ